MRRVEVFELDADDEVGCYFCMTDGNHAAYRRGEAFLAGPDHTPWDGNANFVCRAHLDNDAVIVSRRPAVRLAPTEEAND